MMLNLVTKRITLTNIFKYGRFYSISTLYQQKILCKPLNINWTKQFYKKYSTSYEGDGKTTVKILNTDMEIGLMINSYSQFGFRLNNEMHIIGPMILFPRSVLSWNISGVNDINEESLRLFTVLEPKIDILVIGTGDHTLTPEFSKRAIQFMTKYKINCEILRTEQACTTFNFLNAEGRVVAAALVPPHHIKINEDDLMRRHIKDDNMFALKD